MDILKGFITKTFVQDGALRAQIKIDQDDPIEDVLLVFPSGFKSNPDINIDGSMALLFMNRGLNFAMPFNPLLGPLLENGEDVVGNLKKGNQITFKANGDIEILASDGDLKETVKNLSVTASTKITLTAPLVDLADAVGLVLNNTATMNVTVTGGSSAGTYPVTIVSAGQTKVKA